VLIAVLHVMGQNDCTGELVGCHSGKPASDWIGSSQSGSQHTAIIPNEISQMGPLQLLRKQIIFLKKNPI